MITVEHKSATATIVADSVSSRGHRLTTVHLRYPRMVHAEVMTHREFSRNGRSSRAVPVLTLVAEPIYVPHMMANARGMVALEELPEADRLEAERVWRDMAEYCRAGVERLRALNVHKQWANRPLEWHGHIDVLVSSTGWANFMALRDEAGAQPEAEHIAKALGLALKASTPRHLRVGDWHVPYIRDEDREVALELANGNESAALVVLRKLSVARCARLSIRPFDGNDSLEAEFKRFDGLMVARPVHASPAEHVATPDTKLGYKWSRPREHGNFIGWRQFRKLIPHEFVPSYAEEAL